MGVSAESSCATSFTAEFTGVVSSNLGLKGTDLVISLLRFSMACLIRPSAAGKEKDEPSIGSGRTSRALKVLI